MYRALAVVCLLSAACLDPQTTTCADGTLCPGDEVCDGTGSCVDPVALTSCADADDGATCQVTAGVPGECHANVCRLPGCGNGALDGGEACDDGNNVGGDGCAADCRSDERCGNGVVDGPRGEQCDDGNLVDGDDCQATCLRPACGDGIVDAQYFETCDLGADNSTAADAACRPNCQPRRCGDGTLDVSAGEICDDGNAVGGDGCAADCGSDEACGNDVIDPGEQCDDGNLVDGDGCQAGCTTPACGDGVRDDGLFEECDLGPANSLAPDAGCRPNCRLPTCGDAVIDALAGEVCDDGGRSSGDGCSFDCASDETCGNGAVDFAAGEQCDDGSLASADGCDSTCAGEVRQWRELPPPAPPTRTLHRLAYDEARGRLVLFGGIAGGLLGDTWELVDGAWRATSQRVSPSPRSLFGLTYDATRGRVILFGGVTEAGDAGDTWAYDGVWQQLHPAHAPSARSYLNLAYDRSRDRVVLFGGRTTAGALADTWEFDGTDWAQVSIGNGPDPRVAHAMAYDESDARTVLYGGVTLFGSPFCDTWGYDATGWALLGTSPGSCPVQYSAAYDPQRARVVLYSGSHDESSTVHEFDGATWSARPVGGSVPPGQINGNAIAYDRAAGAVVIAGGTVTVGPVAALDAWQLVVGWSRVAYPRPPALAGAGLAYDSARRRGVMFGGLALGDVPTNATWRYEAGRWRQLTPATSPSARSRMAIAYDAWRDRVVLFGGEFYSCASADTWEFDGTTWLPRAVSGPAARQQAVAAWDSRRGVTYVLGGVQCTGGANYDDLWAFDGTSWTEVAQGGMRPAARRGAVMIYDPVRDRLVLSGGSDGLNYLGDTWEFDPAAGTWQAITTAVAPVSRSSSSMVYDPNRRSALLFGGNYGGHAVADAWAYDGDAWTRITTLDAPPSVMEPALMFDPVLGGAVVVGGRAAYSGATISDAVWLLDWRGAGLLEQCELGTVDDDDDGLVGCDDPDCWYVCTPTCAPGDASC